jgi:hypothetical protein
MCTRADRKECAHSKKKKQKNVKLEINSFRNVLVLENRCKPSIDNTAEMPLPTVFF